MAIIPRLTKAKSKNKLNSIDATLQILGDKWTALILAQISEQGLPFSKLESSLVGISPRTLSARLDKLQREKIVEKTLYCKHPPRYRYSLTHKGQGLGDILDMMSSWGSRS
jgi:DNA-binding HxlR family transcriptional regulator